jgi:hypothetical protein
LVSALARHHGKKASKSEKMAASLHKVRTRLSPLSTCGGRRPGSAYPDQPTAPSPRRPVTTMTQPKSKALQLGVMIGAVAKRLVPIANYVRRMNGKTRPKKGTLVKAFPATGPLFRIGFGVL